MIKIETRLENYYHCQMIDIMSGILIQRRTLNNNLIYTLDGDYDTENSIIFYQEILNYVYRYWHTYAIKAE